MSKVRYYHTDDMEAAVRSLSERHRNVLVLMDYKSVRPIRMNTRGKLWDLDIDWCMGWKPNADEVVSRWRAKGGILQYRSNPRAKRPHCPEADAIVFVECPMQWDQFEHQCLSARQEVVVYRPPTWSLHERTIEHLFPSREAYETIEAYMDALVFGEFDEVQQRAIAASGYKRGAAFMADDLMQVAGWDEKFLRYLLRRYSFQVTRWHPYKLRLQPRSADMRWAWDVLCAQPEFSRKCHALRFNELYPRRPGFKTMMRRLSKENYISPEDCIYVVDSDRRHVDIDVFVAVNNMHRGRWLRIRNFVDDMEEYRI